MAKTNMLMREKKRLKVAKKYAKRRAELKELIRDPKTGQEGREAAQVELQKQPRDAGATRQRNRCSITGRSRGVYRKFGLARTKLREAANRAVQQRQTRTASGRLVRFRFDEGDRQQISMTQRNGKNTPIQGTSADILKRALRLLEDQLRDTSAKIVNIIHDEIVVEVDAGEAEAVAQKVERAMCAAGEEYLQTVPVKVETEIADEWVK